MSPSSSGTLLTRLRLTYDAAITKVEKMRSSKKEKEKERKDAEDEYERAKSRL